MAFSSGKKVHLLVSILAAITLIIFSHSGILHLKLKMKSVHCIPKTELNEQATPFQDEVEGFVKVQARREGGIRLVRSHPPQAPEVHLFIDK